MIAWTKRTPVSKFFLALQNRQLGCLHTSSWLCTSPWPCTSPSRRNLQVQCLLELADPFQASLLMYFTTLACPMRPGRANMLVLALHIYTSVLALQRFLCLQRQHGTALTPLLASSPVFTAIMPKYIYTAHFHSPLSYHRSDQITSYRHSSDTF
jgi:hypothetical protein